MNASNARFCFSPGASAQTLRLSVSVMSVITHYFRTMIAPLQGCWKYLQSQRESIPPERARTSEPHAVMCGSSDVWPLLTSRSISPEHPSPSSRQTAASKRNGAKRFLAVTRCQMGGREAARESRDKRCQPSCVQQEVQLVNQTQHWNCTSARCNSHTWCISQLVLYRFPTTPSVKAATITAPHRWGAESWQFEGVSVKLHANSVSICLGAAVEQSQSLCKGLKATRYMCVISCA